MSGDVVAIWSVSLADGVHQVKFEHGTTTGKRIVTVDGKEVLRKNWLFKLVGKVEFDIGKVKAYITIEAVSGFAYEYTLFINGKPLQKFVENRKRTARVWTFCLDGVNTRIVLEKDTMDVWVNGNILETAGEFVDDGTETHFEIDNHVCVIKAVSSGKQKEGIIHSLILDGNEMPEAIELFMETNVTLKQILDNLNPFCKPFGFEFHPFLVGWYNAVVDEKFHLQYNDNTLGICIVSTPSFFERSFLPYIRDVNCELGRDPLDQCIAAQFQKIKSALHDHNVEIIHDFELHEHVRRPKVLVQTLGHVSGAAFYYQKSDVVNPMWAEKKIYGVCIHPVYGGWFAFRGTIIFTDVKVPTLEKRILPDKLSNKEKITLLEKYNYHWRDWTYRDIISVHEKYSDLQRKYFDTKPAERFDLIKSMKDDVGHRGYVEGNIRLRSNCL